MLHNINKSKSVLQAVTNGGFKDLNLGKVWYNHNSIANILSLAAVCRVCRVTIETAAFSSSVFVHPLDGLVMELVEQPSGNYVFKPTYNSDTTITAYNMLVSTVTQQKRVFTRRQVEATDVEQELYHKLGRPNKSEFCTYCRTTS